MSRHIRTQTTGQFFGQRIRAAYGKDFGFYEYEYEPDSEVPTHAHEHSLVSLLIRGSYAERLGTHERKNPFWVVYHNAGEEHSERFGPRGARLFGFHVPSKVIDTLNDCGARTCDAHENFGPQGTALVLRMRRALLEGSQIGL